MSLRMPTSLYASDFVSIVFMRKLGQGMRDCYANAHVCVLTRISVCVLMIHTNAIGHRSELNISETFRRNAE
jgi:hypothetical protein